MKRRPRSFRFFFIFLFFEGRRRLYTGYLWVGDVNIVPVSNRINYFCLFFFWQLKRCWQTTLLSNFTTHDQHMKPVYRRPLVSVHRLAKKLFAMSTLKSKYKISSIDFCASFSFVYNKPPAVGFCTLCFCFPTKMLHLNAPFFPLKCSDNAHYTNGFLN